MKQRVIVWCAKKFPTLVCIKSHCIYYFLSCTIDMWAVWLRQDRWMTSSTSNCDHYDCTRCSSLLSPGQHCENSIVLRAFTQHVEAYTYMIAYCHRHGCISNRRRRDCAVKWRHVEWRGPHSDAKPLKPICWGLSFCCWHLKKKKRAALNIAKYGDSQKHNWVIFHVFSGGGGGSNVQSRTPMSTWDVQYPNVKIGCANRGMCEFHCRLNTCSFYSFYESISVKTFSFILSCTAYILCDL